MLREAQEAHQQDAKNEGECGTWYSELRESPRIVGVFWGGKKMKDV